MDAGLVAAAARRQAHRLSGRRGRRGRPGLAALALLLGCAPLPAWRAGDPAQARGDAPSEAGATLGGVTVRVIAGGWRSWPERLSDRVTPVEIVIRNGGPAPVVIRPERFTLEREGAAALPALEPGDLPRALGPVERPLDPDLLAYAARPTRSGASSAYLPYAWPGLSGPDVTTPLVGHGPDPRPSPVGVIEAGRSADLVVFFDVPANGLTAFTLVVELTGAGEAHLGTLRFPFRR